MIWYPRKLQMLASLGVFSTIWGRIFYLKRNDIPYPVHYYNTEDNL